MHDEDQCWRELGTAADRADVGAALRAVYAGIAAAVAQRAPTCWQSGNCCHFESYGHRLYVTGLEVAWFLKQVAATEENAKEAAAEDAPVQADTPGRSLPLLKSGAAAAAAAAAVAPRLDGLAIDPHGDCPFQVDNLCTAHAMRPLGCRIFFCEKGTESWQHETYERFMHELRQVHERFDLPYRYLEWRSGLADALRVLHGR